MTNLSELHAQLRRMRAMDYRYHALFFRYIKCSHRIFRRSISTFR